MAILRRRDKGSGIHQDTDFGLDKLDLDTVTAAVLDTAEAATGSRPTITDGPTPVLVGCGPDAYWYELAASDPRWSGSLIVLKGAADKLACEAGWLQVLRTGGFPVPDLLAGPPGDLLIYRQPPGDNLTKTMVGDLTGIPKLIAGFAELHARLHRIPLDGLDPVLLAAPDPLDVLEQRASSPQAKAAIADEVTWLRRGAAQPTARVVCHGAFNPLHVYVEGGDVPGAIVLNWSESRVADPAFDVAATVTGFWASPFFIDNAMYRKGMKMARDSLVSSYLEAYNGSSGRPADDQALRYWQVYHLTALMSDAVRKQDDTFHSPWDAARGIVNPDSAIKDLRARIRELASK